MADNTSPEEQNNEAREEFPQKLRVHALARLLGLTSKEVLAHLGELGFVARSAHSSIDRSAAERVRDRIAESADSTTAETATPAAEEADVVRAQRREVGSRREHPFRGVEFEHEPRRAVVNPFCGADVLT